MSRELSLDTNLEINWRLSRSGKCRWKSIGAVDLWNWKSDSYPPLRGIKLATNYSFLLNIETGKKQCVPYEVKYCSSFGEFRIQESFSFSELQIDWDMKEIIDGIPSTRNFEKFYSRMIRMKEQWCRHSIFWYRSNIIFWKR